MVIEFYDSPEKEQDTEIKDESTNSVQDAAAKEKERVDALAENYAKEREEASKRVDPD